MCRLALPGAVRSVLTQPCGSGLPGKGRVLACGVGRGAHLRVWGARSLTSPVFSQAHGVAVAVEVGEVTHRSPSLPASGGPVLPPRRAVSLDSRATHPHRRGQACVRMGREVPGRRLWDKGGGRNSCRWGWRSRDRVGCPHGARLTGSRASGAGPWGQGWRLAGNGRTSPLKLTRRVLESTLTPSRGRLGVSASHYGNNPSGSSEAEKRRVEVAPESGGCKHPPASKGGGSTGFWSLRKGRAARDAVLGSCWLTAASGTARQAQPQPALLQGEEEQPQARRSRLRPLVCRSVSQGEQRRLRRSGLDGKVLAAAIGSCLFS